MTKLFSSFVFALAFVGLSLAISVSAQVSIKPVYVLVDVLPVSQDGFGQFAEYSPEYFAVGDVGPVALSFFGFYEARQNAGYGYFTNHVQGLSVPSMGGWSVLSIQTEFGAGDGNIFGQVGLGINLTSTPVIGDALSRVFDLVAVTEFVPL